MSKENTKSPLKVYENSKEENKTLKYLTEGRDGDLLIRGAYMSAKPLARIPKVGPIISAVVGDIAQRKSGKVYDSVIDIVTGKKTKSDKPKSPLRGQL